MPSGDDPSRAACRAVLEVGATGATLRFERAVDGDALDLDALAIDEAVDTGWILEREGAYFLTREGVDELKSWLDDGEDASGCRIPPETLARIRPRFGGSNDGLFTDSHHDGARNGHES